MLRSFLKPFLSICFSTQNIASLNWLTSCFLRKGNGCTLFMREFHRFFVVSAIILWKRVLSRGKSMEENAVAIGNAL